ncbi:MAG: hypothetical protein WCN92_07855 [Eubacteriales bacterium]
MLKRIIALAVLSIYVLLLCSCAKNDQTTTAAANTIVSTTENFITTVQNETTSNPATASNSETTSSAVTISNIETTIQQLTSVVTAAPAQTTTAKAQPFTTAEIVSYFNTAANMVKIKKPGYKSSSKAQTQEKNITLSSNVPLHSFISKFIASKINSTKAEVVIVNKGASHKNFPVKGQNWASKLEPSALKSASLVTNGAFYEIELNFNDEKLSALVDNPATTAHGKAFSLLLNKDFRSAFGGFDVNLPGIKVRADNQKFAPHYHDSYIKCKVEKSSGKMINATYYLNTFSDVEMLITVNSKETIIGIKMEYAVTEEYQFN